MMMMMMMMTTLTVLPPYLVNLVTFDAISLLLIFPCRSGDNTVMVWLEDFRQICAQILPDNNSERHTKICVVHLQSYRKTNSGTAFMGCQ